MFEVTKEILEEYFYGKCPRWQARKVRDWLSDPSNEGEAMELMRALFDRLDADDPVLAGQGFEAVRARLGLSLPRREKPSRRVWRVARTVAAVCAVPLLVLSALLWRQGSMVVEWHDEYAAYGEMKQVVLPDNSVVWLNLGSRISYPSVFRGKTRQVFVQGELYADIESDSRKPFIIKTGDFSVRVLGTRFNMKAYPEDRAVEVVLVEGVVECCMDSDDDDRRMQLKAGDMAYYNRDSGVFEKRNFNPYIYSSFAEGGGMAFFHQPLGDIVAHLERCFNRKIVIMDERLSGIEYFAFFSKDDSLEKILETINMDRSMSITENNGMLFIDSGRR
ncbi:MAG: FecR domain-containing protein [Alistipes sp.]|nr:FecR domain-containing protein [Alistipes sp.]